MTCCSKRTRAERSHGRKNKERERERERERDRDRDRDRQYGHQDANLTLYDEEEEQRRQAKRKLKWKWRERQWQYREETVATNREREAERDLDIRESKFEIGRKLAEWDDAGRGQEEYYKDRSRWWFHRQQFRARELATPAEDEEFDDEEDENILSEKLQPFAIIQVNYISNVTLAKHPRYKRRIFSKKQGGMLFFRFLCISLILDGTPH
ncbi:unnamed protein product [Rhizophagus irregularis]|nr:unnamed protein product [Rhizophagus irregularis]